MYKRWNRYFGEVMSAWFKKNLGDAMLATEQLDRIKKRFLSSYSDCNHSNASNSAAVFIRHESEGRLHCEVHVYFSPAAFSVANAVGAKRCKKPMPDDLSLLIGPEDALAIFFKIKKSCLNRP
ncbi:MAG: hypothetical protein OQK75_05945 [Gammaproteobacteria bacterium]|nr:hypothetical protein [Gammaproteobacteria bacterium]MCW8987197.1 hypothetical protein [Gammaproteobacteria bacterium]